MSAGYQVVRDFEEALEFYTGAAYAVTTNSCSMAILLAVAWHTKFHYDRAIAEGKGMEPIMPPVQIPAKTYCSVPMSVIHAGRKVVFTGEEWKGAYQLWPTDVWDSARRFTGDMYVPGQMQCVSFQTSKILGIEQGGAILLDNKEAAAWLRRARFDGRDERQGPKYDHLTMGYHCYMNPSTAALGLQRLLCLPHDIPDQASPEYPDLSTMEIFK